MISADNPFDIFSQNAQANYPLYERMRREDPVHRAIHPYSGEVVWFLTGYADCSFFLKDKRFGKEYQKVFGRTGVMSNHAVINQHMLNLDEPDHGRLKGLVHKVFSPNRIQVMRGIIQRIADKLLQAIDESVYEGEEFDLASRYTALMPLLVLAEIIGIPSQDYEQFRAWAMALLLEESQGLEEAVIGLSMYLNQEIDQRHEYPDANDDLLTALIFAEDAGQKLSRQEVVAMIFLLITAGHETMVNFLGNAVLILLDKTQQMQLLKDNLDDVLLIKSCVEELLRYRSPSYMSLPSWAFEDVAIGAKIIRRGDKVHAVLHAANHDPTVFKNPEIFDILREPNKHLAFSQGIHHCLGAPLARMEAEICLVSLLRWMPSL